METLTRKTASRTATRNQVDALSRTVQGLWSATPTDEPAQREMLLVRLTGLEFDIERLRFRSAIGELRSDDLGDLRDCAERLAQLERQWPVKDLD